MQPSSSSIPHLPVAVCVMLAGMNMAPNQAYAGNKLSTMTLKQKPLEDSKLTCKQISGKIQVLILDIRTYNPEKQSSALSHAVQSAFVGAAGALDHGADPHGEHAAEIVSLKTYNQRLVNMGCRSYDLDKELSTTDPNELPAATVPAHKRP